MYPLTHTTIFEWWEECRKKLEPSDRQVGLKIFNYIRISVIEIPNKPCYNYLSTCGYKCNRNGEILLSEEEYLEYVSFQDILLEGEGD